MFFFGKHEDKCSSVTKPFQTNYYCIYCLQMGNKGLILIIQHCLICLIVIHICGVGYEDYSMSIMMKTGKKYTTCKIHRDQSLLSNKKQRPTVKHTSFCAHANCTFSKLNSIGHLFMHKSNFFTQNQVYWENICQD